MLFFGIVRTVLPAAVVVTLGALHLLCAILHMPFMTHANVCVEPVGQMKIRMII